MNQNAPAGNDRSVERSLVVDDIALGSQENTRHNADRLCHFDRKSGAGNVPEDVSRQDAARKLDVATITAEFSRYVEDKGAGRSSRNRKRAFYQID